MSKYEKRGAYHWRDFSNRRSTYHKYVAALLGWVKTGSNDRVLDIGAGDGLIASKLKGQVVGIDADETAVRLAQERGINVTLGDACSLPYPDASFDTVFCGDTIEHLDNPNKAIQEMHRVLRMGGALYLTTSPPDEKRKPNPEHYKEYSADELQQLVRAQNFTACGAVFDRHVRLHAKFISFCCGKD